jgi:hypothetical protein
VRRLVGRKTTRDAHDVVSNSLPTSLQAQQYSALDPDPDGAAMFANSQMTFKNALRDATTKVAAVNISSLAADA